MSEETPAMRAPLAGALTNNETRNLAARPVVIGVDLGGTQIRAAVLRGAELISRVAQLTGEDTAPNTLFHVFSMRYDRRSMKPERRLTRLQASG